MLASVRACRRNRLRLFGYVVFYPLIGRLLDIDLNTVLKGC